MLCSFLSLLTEIVLIQIFLNKHMKILLRTIHFLPFDPKTNRSDITNKHLQAQIVYKK